MKTLFTLLVLLCAAHRAAQAQVLPVLGGKNPDWVLLKTEKQPYESQLAIPPGTDRMPNAAQKSISSTGNHHYYWDAERRLSYDWVSRGSTSIAPFLLVNVREARQDFVYVFRRATTDGKPNYLPGQDNFTK